MLQIQNLQDYLAAYQQSLAQPETFWANIANHFLWYKKWDRVLDWDFDNFKLSWFAGAQTNITLNCLDRHLLDRPNQPAIIWEPNDPKESGRTLTYKELHREVCKLASVLLQRGVTKGDRVCIYMPMVPELAIAVLACARIGAVHSVVFAGFSANALADRISDAQAKIVLTADGAYRGAKDIPLKSVVDEALAKCAPVHTVLVYARTHTPVKMQAGRDLWWHESLETANEDVAPAVMDAEDMLFILYTSGSTGKPKGVVHSTAGYMIYTAYTFANVFQYQRDEVFWCTADVGWVTGHSYLIYGPLLNGAKSIMFEGVPTYPTPARFWEVIDKHQVNIFYTAPTAIRALEAEGVEYVKPYKLNSLRVLGTVGEPINEEAWKWYHQHIGKGRCPIVDTWWQTETGGILISPIAGITPTKPTMATLPLPGIQPVLLDHNGQEITGNAVEGNLCIKFPWPSMLRTTYGDHERCQQTYFSTYKGYYFTGDGCRRDEDGYYRIIGRVDDVINVSGHRLGTAEIEDGINAHPLAVESAVVGYPHDIKGQGIYAFVILDTQAKGQDLEKLKKDILGTVSKEIGPIAKPDKIQFVRGLPKTRSGKIMRRILRKIAEGDTSNLGDTSTLLDPSVVEHIKEGAL
ncbi:MAG: acetate--CoA ligase [Cytophagales bacterium]|nr:MAG: acetate--CoA ligase [Cytophagales bacterium]TAF61868.1 MAG: acetate--CoA ligase [Cytophagales bacterium]